MPNARAPELVLGSVQLGLPYGAANRTGMPTRPQALKLVARAADAGITQFDTARAYGEAESRLGEALVGKKSVRTITKLSPLTNLDDMASPHAVRSAVEASIAESLAALRRDRLDCLLLHRAEHMTSHGGAIWNQLIDYVQQGIIASLGVSVQGTAEAMRALDCRDVRHLQLPYNLLDWRWRKAGIVERLSTRPDTTIHVRSVFLQGILASDASVWPRVQDVDAQAILAMLAEFATDFGRESVADLCLAYVRGQNWVDGVVVGLETEDQLDANLRLFVRPPLTVGQCALLEARIPRLPETLLNPALWPCS
jgi:spore coat polysaccharide biosynthesis protein SpsF